MFVHLAVAPPPEILPLAPLPPSHQLSEQERLHLEEQEEDVLRELRLFLRNVTERLALDRRFKVFTKPVDLEEVGGRRLSLMQSSRGASYLLRLFVCFPPAC